MDRPVTAAEARAALETVDSGRRRVVDEIAVPTWYWCAVALGWVAVGVVTDLDRPWLTAAATLAFGAGHAAVASSATSGRHRSADLSVRADVVGRSPQRLVVAGLVLLIGLTVLGALAAQAAGSPRPVTVASVVVAVVVLLGGPRLLAVVRRRARAVRSGR